MLFVAQDNWTALLNASKEGHHRAVETLIRHGADIEHRDIVSNHRSKSSFETRHALECNCQFYNIFMFQGGWTALMWACYKGRPEVARILLRHAANCNVKGEVMFLTCLIISILFYL